MDSMTIWQQAQTLFESILHLEPEEQDKQLSQSTATDDVKHAVHALLDAHQMGTRTAFSSALNQLPGALDQMLQGTRLGPYVLTEKISEGGMGQIFLAQRDDGEFDKQVVVKLIRCGILSEDLRMRFQRERQILANLEHPNIAHLIDGGQADQHLLFVVMEYVRGEVIHHYCGQHQLSVQQRIRLFIKLCNAVQYAHQKLVIHRDLKPGNVLVNEQGEPKLLDFGIATLLDQNSSSAVHTVLHTQPRTPLYATPEQIDGQPISTATDVYALGVMLYELLSGQRPFAQFEKHRQQLEQAICEQQPINPSHALNKHLDNKTSFIVDGIANRQAINQIAGDLDRIVIKALACEPALRYPTVMALQQDLQAYLANRPVTARAPSLVYRSKKFLSRNRIPAGIAATAIFATIAFIIFIVVQSQQLREQRDFAQQEQSKASAITNLLLSAYDNSDPTVNLGEETSVKAILDKSLEQIDEKLAGETKTLTDLKINMARVYTNLGSYDTAQQLTQSVLTVLTSLPDTGNNELASSYYLLADIHWQKSDYDPALENVELSLKHASADEQGLQAIYLDAQLLKGKIIQSSASLNDAEFLMKDSLAGFNRFYGREHPKTINNQMLLARLYIRKSEYEKANAILAEALSIQEKIQPTPNHVTATMMHELAVTHHRLDEFTKAVFFSQKAIHLRIAIFGEEHISVASSYNLSGLIKSNTDDITGSIQDYLSSISILKAIFGDSDIRIAMAKYNIGLTLIDNMKDLDVAEKNLLEAIEIGSTHYSKPHRNVGFFHREAGRLYFTLNDLESAEQHYLTSQEIFSSAPASRGHLARTNTKLAEIYFKKGNTNTAKELLKESLPNLLDVYGSDHEHYLAAEKVLNEIKNRSAK